MTLDLTPNSPLIIKHPQDNMEGESITSSEVAKGFIPTYKNLKYRISIFCKILKIFINLRTYHGGVFLETE